MSEEIKETENILELIRENAFRKNVSDYIIEETREVKIATPKTLQVFVMEKREWEKIKGSLDEVKVFSAFYQNACWASLGILASSIIFLVTISPEEKRLWIFVLAWVMFFLSLGFSIGFALISLREGKRTLASIEQIKREMEFFEGRFLFQDDENN